MKVFYFPFIAFLMLISIKQHLFVKLHNDTLNPEHVKLHNDTLNPEHVKLHNDTHNPEPVKLHNVTHSPEHVKLHNDTLNPELAKLTQASPEALLMKENHKLNKTIIEQELNLQKMEEKIIKLKQENSKLKEDMQKNLAASSSAILSSPDLGVSNEPQITEKKHVASSVPPILAHLTDSHIIFDQMKLQMERQKDLKNELNTKLLEINQVQDNIKDLYNDIRIKYQSRLGGLSHQVSYLERSNYNMNERLFAIEKEIEKEKMSDAMIKVGWSDERTMQMNSDCPNRKSCNVCIEDPKCVWCRMEGKCVAGDIHGPRDGSCVNSFDYSTCS